jgi:hypothetical protein
MLFLLRIQGIIPSCANEINYALSFDGSNDFALIPNQSAYNITQYTIELWINIKLHEIPDSPYNDVAALFCREHSSGAVPWSPVLQLAARQESRLPPWKAGFMTRDSIDYCRLLGTQAIIDRAI